MNHLALFLISICSATTKFTFKSTSRVSTADNWLNEEVPCHGDNVRFDNTLPVVAFMDHNLDAETIILPENGILSFTDNGVELGGGKTNWQCENTGIQKDAFFTRDTHLDTSFFSPNSWILDEVNGKFLHMNQVPSEYDDVAVSSLSSAQIYLDLPVVVNSFQWHKKYTMTTDDFNVLIRSMEGQFQLQLARPWAHESDLGGIQRMVAEDPVTVRNRKLPSVRGGRVNPNSRNKTLSTICEYVRCEPEHTSQCIRQFTPFGHCCPVCGAKIELIAWDLDYEQAKRKIEKIMEELEGSESTVTLSFERKTVDEFNSQYEIVIALKPEHHFDEEFYEIAARRIVNDLAISMHSHSHKSIVDFTIHLSQVDRTIRTVSKVFGALIYFIVLIGLLAGFVYRNLDVQVSRRTILKPIVRYKRQHDDVAIELEDVGSELPELSELQAQEPSEEEHFGALNPNFEETSEGIELAELLNFGDQNSEKEETEIKLAPRAHSPEVLPRGDLEHFGLNPNFEPNYTETHSDILTHPETHPDILIHPETHPETLPETHSETLPDIHPDIEEAEPESLIDL